MSVYANTILNWYIVTSMLAQISSKSTRFNPYFGKHNNIMGKGLNLVDLVDDVFHLCMHGCNYPAGIVFA